MTTQPNASPSATPADAVTSHAASAATVRPDRSRREPCVCRRWIEVDDATRPEQVEAAVRHHNQTPEHTDYRAGQKPRERSDIRFCGCGRLIPVNDAMCYSCARVMAVGGTA